MLFHLFLKGLLTGLLVSLPLGPVAILVIQRTANRDFRSGFYTGLGIAITDTFWAILAGFSVSFLIAFLRQHQVTIQIIGAIVLFLLGLYIFRSHPLQTIRKYKRKGSNPLQCFFSAILIALSNPIVMLAYIAVFASANLVFNIHHLWTPVAFSSGFFIGAMSWWTTITLLISRFRHHFNLRILWWFNKISGSVIIAFIIITTIVVVFKGNPLL
ncbi:MAG: LysE family translocator [Prolixibacteraceae bacterium]